MPGSEGLLKRLRVHFDVVKPIKAYTPVEDETHASHALASHLLGASGITLSELIKRDMYEKSPHIVVPFVSWKNLRSASLKSIIFP